MWQDKLSQAFPSIKFLVCPKADSLFKIVGAASIVAKVTRDRYIEHWSDPEGDLAGCDDVVRGSGYPSGESHGRGGRMPRTRGCGFFLRPVPGRRHGAICGGMGVDDACGTAVDSIWAIATGVLMLSQVAIVGAELGRWREYGDLFDLFVFGRNGYRGSNALTSENIAVVAFHPATAGLHFLLSYAWLTFQTPRHRPTCVNIWTLCSDTAAWCVSLGQQSRCCSRNKGMHASGQTMCPSRNRLPPHTLAMQTRGGQKCGATWAFRHSASCEVTT